MEQDPATPSARRTQRPLPSLAEQVQRAEARSLEGAYAGHRAQILSRRGAPVFASRGRGDCLALVLLPFGLILLVVHPLPATLVLLVVAWLVLSGSDRFRQQRAEIAEAEAEALRLWLAAGHRDPAGGEPLGRGGSQSQR